MMVTIEKMEVTGTLLTNLGRFTVLGHGREDNLRNVTIFPALDEEGFYNYIGVRGNFILIPNVLKTQVDVKRVLTDEEVQTTNIPAEILPETIE